MQFSGSAHHHNKRPRFDDAGSAVSSEISQPVGSDVLARINQQLLGGSAAAAGTVAPALPNQTPPGYPPLPLVRQPSPPPGPPPPSAKVRGISDTGNSVISSTPSATQAHAHSQLPLDYPVSAETGMFVYDLPINDAQHRLLVTTGVTQRRLGRELGIDLTTRGRYYSNPTEAAAAVGVSNPNDQPLFLHLEARTVEIMNRAREILERAVHFGELPWSSHGQSSTADGSGGGGGGGERRSRYGQQQQQQQQHQWTPRSRFGPDAVSERFPIDINPNHPRFNLRSKLLGPRGEYIKHIQDHCGVQLILRGLSQNEPPPTSSDQIYMECNAPSQQSLEQARELFNSLLQTIRTQFNEINR